jgi:hypothetical protein
MTEDSAKALLLKLNPLVPQLAQWGESWASVRVLSEEIKEFGWHGAYSLPTVRQMLRTCMNWHMWKCQGCGMSFRTRYDHPPRYNCRICRRYDWRYDGFRLT